MASTTIGQRLKETRVYLGYPAEPVSRFAGIALERLYRIERDQVEPDPTELVRFARLYQRPVAWFTGELGDLAPDLTATILATTTGLDSADTLEVLKFAEFLRLRKLARNPAPPG